MTSVGEYVKLGPKGATGAAALEKVLGRASSAQSSGDVFRILRAYTHLVQCK